MRAAQQFEGCEHHVNDRLTAQLDEIVADPLREPSDSLDPLASGPFETLRVGEYRLACILDGK